MASRDPARSGTASLVAHAESRDPQDHPLWHGTTSGRLRRFAGSRWLALTFICWQGEPSLLGTQRLRYRANPIAAPNLTKTAAGQARAIDARPALAAVTTLAVLTP